MDAITSADESVAVGQAALGAMTTVGYNVAVGRAALGALTTNSQNVAVGWKSFQQGNGFGNAGCGHSAGGNNSMSGSYNTCMGFRAGDAITSGDGNVCLGSIDVASATGDNQLAIGTYDGSTTTTWITGESTGNVEINTSMNPSLTTTGKALVMGF